MKKLITIILVTSMLIFGATGAIAEKKDVKCTCGCEQKAITCGCPIAIEILKSLKDI